MSKDYWKDYWSNKKPSSSLSPHINVSRTIDGVPISDKDWKKTLEYISNLLNIKSNDNILDLCAGNGLISTGFSDKCESILAVDYSRELLNQIDNKKFSNVETQFSDVREIDFPKNSFSKIIIYFAIQHFTYSEVTNMFGKLLDWLTPSGILLIGDIPDHDRLWEFFNTSERELAYFDSLKNDTPIVGTWFSSNFFVKLSLSTGFVNPRIIKQPDFLINSHYRFDFTATKK